MTRTPTLFALTVCLVLAGMAATVPRPSPEFVINMPDGKQTMVSQYRGKILAVAFISTT